MIRKLVLGSTFTIHPPRGGGQLRIFHLYRELARLCPVDVIALAQRDQSLSRRELAPGLTEITIPMSQAHGTAEDELHRACGVAVTDIAFADLHDLTPAYGQAVAAAAVPGCVFVASHPYAFPAMRAAVGERRYWYDAHNVEADLKGAMLPGSGAGKRLLARARSVERDCFRAASRVLASCSEDSDRLRALYGDAPDGLTVVPNGVDTASIRFVAPGRRRELRKRLRLSEPMALFIGSWHEPNLVAAREVVRLAGRLPEVRFAIAGSVGIPLAQEPRPTNVELFGVVSEALKEALLGIAEVALNPMQHGSGTNMKMLDYMAAGVPVISTEVGIRGLGLDPARDARVVGVDDFESALRAVLAEPTHAADARALTVRAGIEQRFDWAAVVAPLRDELRGPSEAGLQPAEPLRSATRV